MKELYMELSMLNAYTRKLSEQPLTSIEHEFLHAHSDAIWEDYVEKVEVPVPHVFAPHYRA